MNELVMQMRCTRAAQMIFMATALSCSAACNIISGANGITFEEPNGEGNGNGGGGGGGDLSGDMMNVSGPTSSTGGESGANNLSSVSSGLAPGLALNMNGQISCKGKDVMLAVDGRAGSWLDAVSVICAELKSDGTTGTPYRAPAFGGLKGDTTYKALCQPGQVVVEVTYTHDDSSSYAYKVSVGCAVISDWKKSGTVSSHSSYVGGIGVGGTKSSGFICPKGEVAAGIDVSLGGAGENLHVSSFNSLYCIPAP